jgi:TfoX/Sxy family transcriptional regulator of competence genes
MAYNEAMTFRLRQALGDTPNVEEKKMFRGVTFMVNGKMCMSAGDDEFMFRIDPAKHNEAVERPGARAVVMKGRNYIGYVRVKEDSVKTKRELDHWVKLALAFNATAKAAPKKSTVTKKNAAKKVVAKKPTPKKGLTKKVLSKKK